MNLAIMMPPNSKGATIMQELSKAKFYKTKIINLEKCNMDTDITEACAVWGILRGGNKAVDTCISKGLDFYYLDNEYFLPTNSAGTSNLNKRFFRVSKNETQNTKMKDRPNDRWEKLDQPIHPWSKTGSAILICPPTQPMYMFHRVESWLDNTINQLKKFTDRKLVLRLKPNAVTVKYDHRGYLVRDDSIRDKINAYENVEVSSLTLEEDLKRAYAVVTFNSNIALKSLQNGVPVFVSEKSAARPIAHTDLSKIETPHYGDRNKLFCHLAYSQFSFDDFRDGTLYRILEES